MKLQCYSWTHSGWASLARNVFFRNVAGQAVFRKSCVSYQQCGGSELSNNHGVFTQQITLLPLATSSGGCTGHWPPMRCSYLRAALFRALLSGRDAHCVPLTLPRWCWGKQNVEQPRLELSAKMEVSIQRNSCGVFIETEQLHSGFHGRTCWCRRGLSHTWKMIWYVKQVVLG